MTDSQPDVPAGQDGNPFVAALVTLGSLALAIGIITVIVGVANGASYDPSGYSDHGDSGVGELAIGDLFCSVGTLVLIAGLIVAGVDWSIRHHVRRD